jgi:uncharacterized membrane protein YccF (DUF307 family)
VQVAVPVAAELDDATRTTTSRTTVTRRWQREEDLSPVSCVGNALWIVAAGGGVIAFVYLFLGLMLVCTVVLAPFGLQLIKLGRFALAPFGKHVDGLCNSNRALKPMDAVPLLLNALWFPVGLLLVLFHLLCGLACACTCYGIIVSFPSRPCRDRRASKF